MLIFLDPSPKYSGDLPVFSLIPDLKHDIFELFLTVKSKLFHPETVDGIKDVIDILSLLLTVA
jgi:hypothetical protein